MRIDTPARMADYALEVFDAPCKKGSPGDVGDFRVMWDNMRNCDLPHLLKEYVDHYHTICKEGDTTPTVHGMHNSFRWIQKTYEARKKDEEKAKAEPPEPEESGKGFRLPGYSFKRRGRKRSKGGGKGSRKV